MEQHDCSRALLYGSDEVAAALAIALECGLEEGEPLGQTRILVSLDERLRLLLLRNVGPILIDRVPVQLWSTYETE